MKTAEELQQDYEKYLDYVRCDRYGFTYDELNNHSIEELQALGCLGWSDEAGEELYRIFILRRRTKMNMQFVFDKESIEAIVLIDKQLKEHCRQLKKETENLINYMLEQKKESFYINGFIKIRGSNSFFDCAISVLDEYLLSFRLDNHEDINMLSIFNFDRNYADKILTHNTQRMMFAYNALEGCHLGYAFYELYRNGCLSLQDIVEDINGFSGKIELHYNL